MDRHGLVISRSRTTRTTSTPDPGARQAANDHLRSVIDAAALLDVEIVGTFIGRDQRRSLEESFEDVRQVWPPIVAHARERGVRIAIENCPMLFSADEWPGGRNLAYSPAIWRELFRILPDDTIGLNLDPSHLVWLMIDPARVVRDFRDRISTSTRRISRSTATGSTSTARSRSASAGRSRGCPASARCAGTGS
jgi:sugar phosphate isomerase/epimerase